MQPARVILIFERSPEDSLTGVDEAIRALGQNGIDVKVAAQNSGDHGVIGRVLRFWFPYLSREGVVGVTPDAAAELREFVVTLDPKLGPVFGSVLAAWLQVGNGRKLRVKFQDVEIEAQTPEQMESLLSRVEASR